MRNICAFSPFWERSDLTTGLLLFKTLPGFPPQSSCIPFSYWKETVSVLLGSDRTSLCAIASYIDEPFMDLDRDLLEDWPSAWALSAGAGRGRGSLGVWTPEAGEDSAELLTPLPVYGRRRATPVSRWHTWFDGLWWDPAKWHLDWLFAKVGVQIEPFYITYTKVYKNMYEFTNYG